LQLVELWQLFFKYRKKYSFFSVTSVLHNGCHNDMRSGISKY